MLQIPLFIQPGDFPWKKPAPCEQFKSVDDWAQSADQPSRLDFWMQVSIFTPSLCIYLVQAVSWKISWTEAEQRFQPADDQHRVRRISKAKRWFWFFKEAVPRKRRRSFSTQRPAWQQDAVVYTVTAFYMREKASMFVWIGWPNTNILMNY